jgi:hypothetical protein
MQSAMEKITEIIKKQPDDATYEEILRELAFERMIQNGLKDSRSGKRRPRTKCGGGSPHGGNKVDRFCLSNAGTVAG